MSVKAIIFDLDGTLADTLQDLTDALNYGLKELLQPEHSPEDYRMMVGTGFRELCRKALPPDRMDLLDALMEKSENRYTEHYLDKTKPYPGIVQLLDELHRRGPSLAVLSNKPDSFTRQMTRQMFGPNCFKLILGEQQGVPRKPDPAGVLLILRPLKVSPANSLYVGDSGTDMQTATAAGMHPVGVSWGFRDRSELLAGGAKHIIDEPAELLELL